MPPCEPIFQVIESVHDGENLEKLSMESNVLNMHYRKSGYAKYNLVAMLIHKRILAALLLPYMASCIHCSKMKGTIVWFWMDSKLVRDCCGFVEMNVVVLHVHMEKAGNGNGNGMEN